MVITVESIDPCEHTNLPKMQAVVNFYDETAEFHPSAKVRVFIEKRDVPMSVLKQEAIQNAKDFLKLVLSDHS